jgi:hypothetical protein
MTVQQHAAFSIDSYACSLRAPPISHSEIIMVALEYDAYHVNAALLPKVLHLYLTFPIQHTPPAAVEPLHAAHGHGHGQRG